MSISLLGAVRSCKVDTSYSNRIQSDRFLNPVNLACPIWNGMDTAGRRVSPDTFWTKCPGGNSAEDRVVVENNLRPQYMEYINLSANGIDGAIYAKDGGAEEIYGTNMPYLDEKARSDRFNYPLNREACVQGKGGISCMSNVNNISGNFGLQMGANIYPSCGYYRYDQAMAQEQEALRRRGALNEGFRANQYRSASGF